MKKILFSTNIFYKQRFLVIGAFCIAWFLVVVSQARADAPMMMNLKLDENVGATTSTDATGNGRDGTIGGTITLHQEGWDGYSYYFESLANAGTIRVNDYDYGSDGNFAISMHFKIPDNNVGTSYRYLFSTGNWVNPHTLMMFIGEASLADDGGSLQNKLGFRLADTDDTPGATYANLIRIDVSDEVTDNAWHEVHFVSISGYGAKIYLDGTLAYTTTTRMGGAFDPGTTITSVGQYEPYMNIGWRPRDTTNRYYKGYIDDVRVYDSAFDPYGIGELTIDSWTDKKIYQRVGTTKDITLTGTYNSSTPPTAIEARLIDPTSTTTIAGFDWAVVDAAPSGNYWSGTLSDVPQGGWYRVQVRYQNQPDSTVIYSNQFGVGMVIGCTGQSNMVKFFTEITFPGDSDPDPVVNETPDDHIRLYGYDSPRVSVDEIGQYSRPRTGAVFAYSWHTVTGNGAIRLGNNLYETLGIPIAFLDFGIDGSALGVNDLFYWIDGDDPFRNAFDAGITAAGNDMEILLWHNGYTDARDGTSAPYYANLGTFYDQISALVPDTRELKYLIAIQNRGDYVGLVCDEGDCDAAYNTIRKAQQDYIDNFDYAYSAGNTNDMSVAINTYGRGDGHWYASQYEIWADRVTHGILEAIGYAGEDGVRGPDISQAVYKGREVTVAIDHDQGTGLQLLDSESDIEGFELTDDNWSTTLGMDGGIDNAYLVNGDRNIRVVLTEAPSGTLKMRYLYGQNVLHYKETDALQRNRGNFVFDNYVYHTGRPGLPISQTTADMVVAEDATAATISDVAAATTSSGATITWTTNENTSSMVQYGLSNVYTATTTEADVNTRVADHTVSFSGLVSCATYHYRANSIDLAGNMATSTDATFMTTGCIVDEIQDEVSEEITTAAGGTVELTSGGLGVCLTVPAGFHENDATFQIHQLENDTVLAAASAPSGYEDIGDYFYNFMALENATTSVSSFDQDITVSVTYSNTDIAGLDEATLNLYRWNGSAWVVLNSCTVDSDLNILTCTTSSFSSYGVFGQGIVANSAGSSYGSNVYGPPKEPDGGFKIWINSGADQVETRRIILRFTVGSDVAKMAISEKADFQSASIIPYRDNYLWTLSPGDGVKNIYARFYTKHGHKSDPVSASITLKQALAFRLIKYADSPKVYYLQDNIRHWIADEYSFISRGYQWSDIETIDQNTDYADGQDIKASPEPTPTKTNNYQFSSYLQLGSVGEEVRNLQTILKYLGYFDYPSITGYFGSVTQDALRKFQAAYGIDRLGVVGPKTRAALNNL